MKVLNLKKFTILFVFAILGIGFTQLFAQIPLDLNNAYHTAFISQVLGAAICWYLFKNIGQVKDNSNR